MTRTRWVATVTDQHWLIAKIRTNGLKVKIEKAYSFDLKKAADSVVSESAQELKQFFKKNWISTRDFGLSFSCPGVITRIITVPVMKKRLLEVLFTEQVEQYFTLNVADYIIDYRVLNEVEEEGQKCYKVLLTAVPRDFWNAQMSVLQEAKLRPKVVDVQFECLSRLYARSDSSDYVILNLSGQRAEIVILEQGVFFLFSEVYFDSKELVRLIEDSKDSELSYDSTYLEGLENTFFPVMRNLEEFLTFFTSRHFGKNVDMIYITGEYAKLRDIDKVFRTNLELPTQIAYPKGLKLKFSKKVSQLNLNSSLLGGLIGLALRED
ncbi:pilus assembly protein PilM [Desulfitobacterium metallireducens]|uniref:Pilus assembly protein PilM n=1 Tax=Desulfitobacterium metallireducens DSM 15288 TaxID=871968 RepID=W0ECZ1_9FIRM|nr:pilus assembly protein PilM [Desulfitobacterium metallireducens]AHF08632.1 hypothetical protein DESME_10620 [Desulfitobacterium metallireducens DSM 15288]